MIDSPTLASRLELSGKVIGLLASCCLAASLLFDWGFYFALNLSFREVPSVLSDHVRSGLLWFPKVALTLGFLLAIEMFIRRMEKGMTEDEIIASSSNQELTKRFRDGPQKAFGLLAVLIIIGYIIAGDIFASGLPLGLCVGWVMFSVWAQSPKRIMARRPIAIRIAIHLLPPIAFWLFLNGYNDAIRLYQPTASSSLITLKGTSTQESVVLLRQLDKGLLVREQNGVVGFRPWSEISRIETSGKYSPQRGLVCSWLGLRCLQILQEAHPEERKDKSNPAAEGALKLTH